MEELRQLVRGDKLQWPVTSLVCVENTHNMAGGRVLPLGWLDEVRRGCWGRGSCVEGKGYFNAFCPMTLCEVFGDKVIEI